MPFCLSLNLSPVEEAILQNTSDVVLSVDQLHNISTYFVQLKKYPNPKYTISDMDTKIVLHAINYENDESNMYWLVLTKNFKFVDLGIPITLDLGSDSVYDRISDVDTNILKDINSVVSLDSTD